MPAGSSLQNPSHTYTIPGNYSVALQAYNGGGYNSTRKTGYITVTGTPVPVADFTATPLSGAKPLTVVFTDLSVTSPTTWNWNFGDGNTTNATVQNPVHAYLTPGIYTVSLNVTNSSGFNVTAKTNYILVDFANVAMFRGDRQHSGVYSDGGIAPTNNLKWNYTTGNPVRSGISIADGVVYVGSTDFKVYAFNASNGSKLWERGLPSDIATTPAITNGTVYVGLDSSPNLYALNATTGADVWVFTAGNTVPTSPALAYGYVYAGSTDFKVYALDAASGAPRWNFTTGNAVYSSPAVANGLVYVGSTDNKVYALNAATGSHIWNYTTGNSVYSSPAVADGVVYVGSYDNKVYALNATTGSHIWNYTTGDMVLSSPAIAYGNVYVGGRDANIYALNATTGLKVWNFTTGGIVATSPAVANGVVYSGSNDYNLYAINASTGAKLWNYTTGGIVATSPAVTNGTVFFGSNDKNVYALGGTPAPVASFTANVTSGTKPLAVNFTDLSTNTPTSWNWTFGDGNFSVLQNPVHTYAFNGNYCCTERDERRRIECFSQDKLHCCHCSKANPQLHCQCHIRHRPATGLVYRSLIEQPHRLGMVLRRREFHGALDSGECERRVVRTERSQQRSDAGRQYRPDGR